MEIDKQVLVDLYTAISTQNKIISFLVANDKALVDTLANEAVLSKTFAGSFGAKQAYALTHPTGPVAEWLDVTQRTLDAIGAKVKADTGDWEN